MPFEFEGKWGETEKTAWPKFLNTGNATVEHKLRSTVNKKYINLKMQDYESDSQGSK